jgi:glycosyltransferase involved in cell wall biosynthesis
MSQKFTVDAVIPTWNGAAFLEEAVYSVLSQTYLPAQLIIIDDGSTDNTAALIEKIKLENKGPVTILYHFQQNSGLSAARNKGIALSSAPLIAFLDADDAWHPTKLEKQTELFMHPAFPDLALVYCAYDVMDELSCRQSSAYVTHIRKELQGNVFDLLTTANYISGSGSGVLIRKSCLEKTGGFDTKLGAY